MEGVNAKAGTEILHLTFSKMQASILDHGSRQTAAVGGPVSRELLPYLPVRQKS